MTDDVAGTWGGASFRLRKKSYKEELRGSEVWHVCGTRSEYQSLKSVILAWPSDLLAAIKNPNEALFIERVDLELMRRQTHNIQRAFEQLGVDVTLAKIANTPANFIFMRDLFFMSPEGAILARPASEQRAGEERFAAQALLVASIRGRGLLEGADVLWLNSKKVLIGVGLRTNSSAAEQVTAILSSMNIEAVCVGVPSKQQHLLGLMNIIDHDLVAVDGNRISSEIKNALTSHGYRLIELQDQQELRDQRSLNFVTIDAKRVLLPAGCPNTRKQLRGAGVEAIEVEISEYIKAGGGLACLTGILHRASGDRNPLEGAK
jgi:N-dimethylarginine dimethylaminohydrolase